MSRLTNSDATNMVLCREEFEVNNIFAEQRGEVYAVFSYGRHFPMYVYCTKRGIWYGNSDQYSVTTTRHQNLCRPRDVDEWRTTQEMCALIN